ncbi:MAG: NAD(+) synthase [Firmicutes bacterium HGW-Firmicutes-12]|nr:MAG: NAD(+) synthase [Firmicutes bacterium HGW-Firmicutes-12]
MKNHGFIKTVVASPELKVANIFYNLEEHIKLIEKAAENKAVLIVFPELSLTGYTCGDLFHQKLLLDKSLEALQILLKRTRDLSIVALVGIPLNIKDKLYNCAAVLHHGEILGIVPKMYLPNYKEYYEKRWFSSGNRISSNLNEIELLNQKVPFGNLIFKCIEPAFSLGIEICEDLWMPIPPSSYLSIHGANIIANLSASNDLVAKAEYRKSLVAQQSARCVCAYLYASAGVHESTTDVVFSGDCLICENGQLLVASERFSRSSQLCYAEIDLDILNHDRQVNKSFSDTSEFENGLGKVKIVEFAFVGQIVSEKEGLLRHLNKNPFVPQDKSTFEARCREIFNIQVAGLVKRMEHTHSKHPVVGISGGLDSTLALLVAVKTMEVLGRPIQDVLAITMPGFGTTDHTYSNALELMKELNVTSREINISKACLLHFADIGHDPEAYDVTYENVQARERMQILMDIANKEGGLVVGTGDLSELALGWSTYNGDHMSMYGVNGGIPKTLVRFLVEWAADNIFSDSTRNVLHRISNTPISPELLPPDKEGNIKQKTEDVIGPYVLHDFFLFYMLRYSMAPRKILYLAEKAYEGEYSPQEIKTWLRGFYQRFFRSQFKRSCLPDGPKVGSINLSPRGDWRMPSDADATLWLSELD